MELGQIGFTEEQIDMLGAAEKFCRDKSPIKKVRSLIDDDAGYDVNVWKEIGALGWLAITIPEDYDGVGLSMTEVVPVAEQMGRYMLNSPFISTTLAVQALLAAGTDKQKSKYLPKIAAGQGASLALSEKNGDWDLNQIEAKATPHKYGYELSGVKTFVMDYAAAEMVICSVMLDSKPALVIFNKDQISNGSARRETLIDETKRSHELTLDGIVIAADAVLDPAKTGAAFDHIHLCANLLSAAEMTGSCQAVIAYTVEYLNTRKQFGKLIGSYQALKHPTVDAFVDYQKARSLLYAAAYSFDQQGEGEVATRIAAVQSETALAYAADRSIQFHGGFGFTYDCDAQLYRRSAIFQESQYGDAPYHKRKLADLLL